MIINPPLTHIREYRDADAAAVARMWRESASAWPGGGPGGGEHSTAARVMQEQRDLHTLATFVAFLPDPENREERAVGYCSLFEYTGETDTAYVGTLSAHPDWHGKGVGRDLLRAALERTVELGYLRLDLNTWAGNLKAVPLYKKSGYFWVPDTTVKMENYLPLIFRLPAAQEFFKYADWYRDFKRDLSVRQDDEKRGNVEVYTYRWERDGRSLTVVIDRRAKGVTALETAAYAASIEIDDPRLPIGGRRTITWRIENRGPRTVPVSLLSEGEDAVRCTTQRSGVIERADAWQAAVTAEQPPPSLPTNRPTNRVKSTVIVDGEPVQLVAGTQVTQPVALSFERGKHFLIPGVAQTMWLTLENHLDQPSSGTVRLSATPGLRVDSEVIDFGLEPRSRADYPLRLRADAAGTETLRAQAAVQLDGEELRTKVFSIDLFCGDVGELFVEQTEEFVRPCTDRFAVYVGLKPTGGWMPGFTVFGREAGGNLLTHAASLGPPFVPSVFVNCTWTSRVERRQGARRAPPIYVYAGQGDWKTARSLWRQLVAPDGPRDVLDPKPAHRARLERFAFDGDVAETQLIVESERTRTLSGEVRLEADGQVLASGAVDQVRLGAHALIPVRTELPAVARAVPSVAVLDHERTTERFEAPLLRAGVAGAPVRVTRFEEGGAERVRLKNGRLRLTVIPGQMARMVELGVHGPDGAWRNQLYAPPDEPGVFVWFNPWYGGIHPSLEIGRWYPGRLTKERFTWRETQRTGAHGVRWQGVAFSTVVTGADWSGVRPANGLRIEISYLTVGEGNVLAVSVRVVNDGSARIDGDLSLRTFLQPGGRRENALLHYERDGQVRTQKRVHGGLRATSEAWCAVSGPAGAPAIALVPGAMNACVNDLGDMGLEGAHPSLGFRLRLAPGESFESVGYVVVAEDVAQAWLYRTLRSAGALV